ncbi:DUF3313 domain-containing protein [Azospirillum sp. sgz302134]
MALLIPRLAVPIGTLFMAVMAVMVAGCTSPQTAERPVGLPESARLREDPDRPGAWVYRVPNVDFRRYSRYIVEPVQVYRGSEASFADLSSAQTDELAQLMTSEARRALGDANLLASRSGPNTARIAIKIVRVEPTVPGAATVSRLLPIGAVANAVEGASGGSGTFTGAAVLSAEFYDSRTSKLLGAAVRRYHPATFNMEATLSTMDTARAAMQQAAQDLLSSLQRAQASR